MGSFQAIAIAGSSIEGPLNDIATLWMEEIEAQKRIGSHRQFVSVFDPLDPGALLNLSAQDRSLIIKASGAASLAPVLHLDAFLE